MWLLFWIFFYLVICVIFYRYFKKETNDIKENLIYSFFCSLPFILIFYVCFSSINYDRLSHKFNKYKEEFDITYSEGMHCYVYNINEDYTSDCNLLNTHYMLLCKDNNTNINKVILIRKENLSIEINKDITPMFKQVRCYKEKNTPVYWQYFLSKKEFEIEECNLKGKLCLPTEHYSLFELNSIRN